MEFVVCVCECVCVRRLCRMSSVMCVVYVMSCEYPYFPGNSSEKEKRDFLHELEIFKRVGKHPNVVCLVGACHIKGTLGCGRFNQQHFCL